MKEYISTILYVCIFSIILELILPDNKLKKYIYVLVSLIILLVIASPIIDVLKNGDVVQTISTTLSNISNSASSNNISYDFGDYKNKILISSVRNKLEQEILNSTKLKFSNLVNILEVKIVMKDSYNIDKVAIYVNSLESISLASQIINYVEDTYNITETNISVIERN